MRILFLLSAMFVTTVHAGDTTGEVTKLYINEGGLVLFSLSTPIVSPPGATCSSSEWQYAFKTNVPAGSHMYSMLLSARAAKAQVTVYYTECHNEHNTAAKAWSMYQ